MDGPALRSHLHSVALPAELSANLRTFGSYPLQRHRTFAAVEAGHAPDLDGGSGPCDNQRQACCAILSVFSHIGPAAVANQTGQAPAAIRYV